MKQTKEQRDAWHHLQEMAASDPATSSTMTRYLAALGLILCGKRPRHMSHPEPNLQSGFIMTTAQRDIYMAANARLGMDTVHLAFDHDQTDRPNGIVVIRNEGLHVACYPRNALWSASGSKGAVIVCLDQNAPCHFVFRKGARLAKVEGWPAEDLLAGMRRASGRLHRLAASDELKDARVGGFRTLVQFNKPGGWAVKSDRFAA